ncbi:hypothetical protein TgHK011_006194 [Trichoderma gracile]|nr:hypothetical protein TgHK011_006194 [Trichoderma gracile]
MRLRRSTTGEFAQQTEFAIDSESFGSLRRHLEPSESGVVPVELRSVLIPQISPYHPLANKQTGQQFHFKDRSFPPVPSRCFERLRSVLELGFPTMIATAFFLVSTLAALGIVGLKFRISGRHCRFTGGEASWLVL